jgi:hypothetical protein
MKNAEKRLIEKNGIKDALYGERVNALIRERYTLSEELAILRRRDTAPEQFDAYNTYVEACKTRAGAEWEASV